MTETRQRFGLGWRMWGPVLVAMTLGWGVILADPFSELVTQGDRILLLGRHQAGIPAPKLLVFFGLMFLGPAIGAWLSRATPRLGLGCGIAASFAAVAGLAALGAVSGLYGEAGVVVVGGEPIADAIGVGAMWAFVLTIGFGPPAFMLGAAGGSLGARLGGAGRERSPDAEVCHPAADIPAAGTFEALVRQAALVQADLGEGRRRMSMRQRTLVFEWLEQLQDVAERNGLHPAELGVDANGIKGALNGDSPRDTQQVRTLLAKAASTLSADAEGGYRRPPAIARNRAGL